MTASATTEDPKAVLAADPQDPLPESNWVPRRWFAFLSLLATVVLAIISLRHGGAGIAWVMAFGMLTSFFYLVAPSGEQAIKMIVAASAMKAGVTFRSSSSVTTPDGTASSSSTAEVPPATGKFAPE